MNDDEKLILAKLNDLIKLCDKQSRIKQSNFLDPASIELAQRVNPVIGVKTILYGGYEEAERKIFVALPDWADEDAVRGFVKIIKIENSYTKMLNHRDYLGSILSLGIVREKIGDILVNANGAFVFCVDYVAEYIISNLDKIGNVGVKISLSDTAFLPEKNIKKIDITVASMRLDAILSATLGLSRTKASEVIEIGKVNVNFKKCENISQNLAEDDLISVKGFGRLRVDNIGTLTKKGRWHITIDRYI